MLNIFVVFIAVLLSYIAEKKDNKKVLFLLFIWLSFCCGLRGEYLGDDTSNYITFFYDVKKLGIFYGSDFGFSVISYILMTIFDNPQILLLIFSLITHYFIIYRFWELKKKSSFTIMILVFTIIYYPYCFNIVRQFISIAIIFWATRFLEMKNYKMFLVFNIIAIGFHTTAIVGILYFLLEEENIRRIIANKKKFVYFVVFLSVILIVIFSANLSKYLTHLMNRSFDIHFMTLFKLLCLIVISVLSLNIAYTKRRKLRDLFLILIKEKFALYFLIGIILSLPGMFFSFINRIGFYFLIFESPFWGYIKNLHSRYQIIFNLMLYLILSIYILVSFI